MMFDLNAFKKTENIRLGGVIEWFYRDGVIIDNSTDCDLMVKGDRTKLGYYQRLRDIWQWKWS